MRVLGVDLAAGSRNTYACVIEARDGELRAGMHARCDDARLLDLAAACRRVAIDAPFGWPNDFVDALNRHRAGDAWPAPDDGSPEVFRASLSFRATDRVVMQTRRPLSVSTDKLGVTAMRCAHLLHRWSTDEPVDRTGMGKFVEVYPAAALRRWGLKPTGYKGTDRAALGGLVEAVCAALPCLCLTESDRALAATTDHAFDALVAALVARAAELGLTDGPPPDRRAQAAQEGWIHVPVRGSLPFLGRSTADLISRPARALAQRLRDAGADGRATFHAAHSSAALGANTFAPFLLDQRVLPLPGGAFDGAAELEVECPSGLRGAPPTLDCLIDGAKVLAVVSKGIETFTPHAARFADAYAGVADRMDAAWRDEYRRLVEDPFRYRFLDAAQLVKHHLGLRTTYPDRDVTLAYAYWTPRDAETVPECAMHEAELEEFSAQVAAGTFSFVAMPYRRLWDLWASPEQPEWLRRHAATVRGRYDIVI